MNQRKPCTSFADVETVFMHVIGAQAIQQAVKMHLFDNISRTPMTAADLAERHGMVPEPLEAMLDMFATMGIVTRTEDRFTTSEMADEYLVSTSPFYQGQALAVEFEFSKDIGEQLPTLLKGQSPAREQTDETWATRETMEGTLQYALGGQLQGAVEFLAGLPEFKDFRSMADIGGNHGQYSMELLDRNPSLDSTILDLPHVVPVSQERCTAQGYGDRISCQPFDMRKDALPAAAFDFIFTSHVLYGCVDDLDAFLARIRTALPSGGLFASHHLAPEGGATPLYRTSVEFLTRLAGYQTHFISRETLESALKRTGFVDMEHVMTGADGKTLLLVARRA